MDAVKREDQPKSYAIQPGEYIPWKGFMFQVTEVTQDGFSARVTGVTKRLKHLAPAGANEQRVVVNRA